MSRPFLATPSPHVHDRASQSVIWLDRILHYSLVAGVFFVPLLFSGWTFEPLEINKQSLLLLVACIGLGAWAVKALLEKRFMLNRHWPQIFILAFTIGILASSIWSVHPYLSFVGNYGQEAWSFGTLFACVVFYVLLASEVRTTKQVYNYLFIFLASAGLVGLFSLFQLFDIHLLPFAVTKTTGFNVIGTPYALASFMVIPLIVASGLSFHGCRDQVCLLGTASFKGKVARALVWFVVLVSLAILIVIDFWVTWAALLFGTLSIVVAGFLRARRVGTAGRLVLPAILVVVSFVLLFFKPPFSLQLPLEVAPSLQASWSIARQSLQQTPVLGSGPSTWIYLYSYYRNPAVNVSPFWNVRFDHAISSFLTLLPTVGILGILLWLLAVGSVFFYSVVHLWQEKSDDLWYAYATVFGAWLVSVFLSVFYQFTVTHQLTFWFFTALLSGLTTREMILFDAKRSRGHSATQWVMSLGIVCVVFVGFWLTLQRWYGDRVFMKAAVQYQNGASLATVTPLLEEAIQVNRWDDGYARNAAQAHLLNALSALQAQADASRLPNVQTDISRSLELSQKTLILAPASVDNWASIASTYASIASFTRGAIDMAIRAYGEALKREPQNPMFLDALGQLYINRADAERVLADTKDEKVKAENVKAFTDDLKMAFNQFNQAVTIKPDYLPAHYHLGAVYQRQNKVPEAIRELTQVLGARPNDVGVAFELAILFYQNNEKQKALGLLEQITKAESQNVNARWYLALLYQEMGKLDLARTQLQMLVQQLPDNIAVRQRLDELNKAQKTTTLAEPLKEEVKSQSSGNVLKRK